MIKRRDLLARGALLATAAAMTMLVGVGVAHEYEVGKLKVEQDRKSTRLNSSH